MILIKKHECMIICDAVNHMVDSMNFSDDMAKHLSAVVKGIIQADKNCSHINMKIGFNTLMYLYDVLLDYRKEYQVDKTEHYSVKEFDCFLFYIKNNFMYGGR